MSCLMFFHVFSAWFFRDTTFVYSTLVILVEHRKDL